ncbi:MAG TPA: alpha-hydroxy acid oxidase [Ramlibacter sp.]|nr:alpha-hydroxy acid oxidase [Ramlibacter sp.]
MKLLAHCHNVEDLREAARARLPRGLFEFVDRGAEDESALRHNRQVFERIRFKPRVLVGVSQRRQDITLMGKPQRLPITIAPTGTAGLMWYRGEIELARAAAKAGIPFTLATGSLTAMEAVAAEAGGTLWFQVYMLADPALSRQLVERAMAAGFEALVVTVDGVVPGNREYNLRNGFTLPFTISRRNALDLLRHPGWLAGVLGRYLATTGMPRYENYPSHVKHRLTAAPVGRAILRNDALNWDDLRALRKQWPHKLLVKGVLHPADAKLAADCGADGVIVSNHGGRNLDGAVSPLEVLPQVVEAVRNRMAILVDSGFRRGADVVKALAMGADAVQIGRPALYGTAAAGEAGAAAAIGMFEREIDTVLAQVGCNCVGDLRSELLHFQ